MTLLVYCTLVFTTVAVLLRLYHFGYILIGFPFVGAVGNPHIENSRWQTMTISYWVVYHNPNGDIEEIEQSLSLNTTASETIRVSYNPRLTKGNPFCNQYSSTLITSRRKWYFVFHDPQEFWFTLVSDEPDFGYRSILKDTSFYTKIRSLCADHAKLSDKRVSQNNIRLCQHNVGREILESLPLPACHELTNEESDE